MCYTIYIPLNAKSLTIYLTMNFYGNQQNAIMFVKTNNCNLLRELTQLMGTSWFRPTLEDEHMPKYPIPFSSFLTGRIFLIAYLFLMGI